MFVCVSPIIAYSGHVYGWEQLAHIVILYATVVLFIILLYYSTLLYSTLQSTRSFYRFKHIIVCYVTAVNCILRV